MQSRRELKSANGSRVVRDVRSFLAGVRGWIVLGVAVLLLFPGGRLNAQFESASVLGYVRDSSGAAIPNTTVTLTNTATSIAQKVTTDGEGKFEFSSIQIGQYVVETQAAGFERSQTQPFTVTTNARQRVDVAMKTGSVTETVTVTGSATALETETSSRGQVIATHEIENLPLNGRSYADLVLLAPGVRKSTLQNQTASSREASFNVNGQRSAFNNFLLDGLDNNNYGTSNQGFANENIPPSPDAVSEFRVETNNYSAEYGRASGAVINVSTRRGTNQFHGKAYDYLRNTSLNAIGPFVPVGNVKQVFIRNQFGGTFGGPIYKDHTFFFADYEGLRQIFRNQVSTVTLPNAEQRNGVFLLHRVDGTTAPIPLYNPLTGTAYTTGTIPGTPFGRAVLAALPTNTLQGGAVNSATISNNYSASPRGTIQDDKGDGRIDHTFNARWSLFGRYSEHRGTIFDPPTVLGRAGGNANANVKLLNRQIAGGTTWVISPNKLLDIRFAYTTNQGAKTPFGQGDPSLLTENGITNGIPTDPSIVRDLNAQSISGFTQLGAQPSSPQFQNPVIYDPKANYTWVRGKHSMKFGYEYEAVNTQVNDFNPSYGQDNYNSLYAAGPSATFFPTCSTTVTTGCIPTDTASGNSAATQIAQARALADFLFGNRSSYSLTNFTVVNLRQRFNYMYVQDDMKLTPSLTLNVGLRYELATPQWERDNKLANFNPATNSLIQAKAGSVYDRALVNIPKKNWGPRFGFSYSATPKTVLRGGYGISYTQYNRAGGENNLTYNGPNVVNASINNNNSTYPTATSRCTSDTQDQTLCFRQTQQGYAIGLTAPANFNPSKVTSRYIPKNFATGYVQSYHVGFQQQLPAGVVLDLAYVGNKGTHLQVLADYNQATPCLNAGGAGCAAYQSRRPVTTFGDIEIAYGGNSSNYNSLQAKVEKRAGALYVLDSFTYSRAFDLASGHLETSNNDNSRVNFANPRNDYGPSGYDQPLNNTTSIVYDLPYGHGRKYGAQSNAIVNQVLGGWQLTVINTMTSGLPFNLTYNSSSTNPLYTTDLVTFRPQLIVPSANIKAPAANRVKTATALGGYLDITNLKVPSVALGNTTPYGNVSRNKLRSYAYFNTDLGVHKQFDLWRESSKLEFRAEAFNVLNQVNYQAPDGNISNGSFGSITAAYPARQIQLAAKLIF
ncbi:TonB-dependent receptor [Granulicella sp. dw_53]|uniref:TonB-dependent receptor domain-containing protein n=1 Tax=Granulicella sp. dw_53 TaxID=2719792 RepID=UPI001BD46D75|nr:TonB-dependent receptor [Granulicella sp. dw_53]